MSSCEHLYSHRATHPGSSIIIAKLTQMIGMTPTKAKKIVCCVFSHWATLHGTRVIYKNYLSMSNQINLQDLFSERKASQNKILYYYELYPLAGDKHDHEPVVGSELNGMQ